MSRASVGSGYAVAEQAPGKPGETAWFAFMTTSKETSLDQAKKALEASGEVAPCSASQGAGRQGRFRSRVNRLDNRFCTTASLVFNAKEFQLDTQKEPDPSASAHFAEKGIVQPGATAVPGLAPGGAGTRAPAIRYAFRTARENA